MNKPINQMVVDDCVRAWVQECDIKVPIDSIAYRMLVARCDSIVTSLKDKKSPVKESHVDGSVQHAILSWCIEYKVPPPASTQSMKRISYGLATLAGWDRPKHAHPIPGEFGIPYSVAEARKVCENLKVMDEYHKSLILWLCDEIDRLQALNPNPIPKDVLLERYGRTFVGSLFLSAFSKAFPLGRKENKDALKLVEAKELSLVLVANGVPMDAGAVCVEWDKQVDRMIAEKAAELIKEKMDGLREASEKIDTLVKDATEEFRKRAGIPPEEKW